MKRKQLPSLNLVQLLTDMKQRQIADRIERRLVRQLEWSIRPVPAIKNIVYKIKE